MNIDLLDPARHKIFKKIKKDREAFMNCHAQQL